MSMNYSTVKKLASKNSSSKSCESSKQFYKRYSTPKFVMKQKSKKTVQKRSIKSLPNELLLKLFSFVPIDTLQNVSFVCKRWKSLADDNCLWEQHFQNFFGIGPLYLKLKDLALQPSKNNLFWKTEFFKQCLIQSKKILLKQRKNRFTGIIDNVGTFLSTYKVTFDLEITDNSDKKHTYSSAFRQSSRTSSFLQWNSLNDFPLFLRIQSIHVIAYAPLLLKKEKQHLPRKKSLIYRVDFKNKSLDKKAVLGCDEHHQLELRIISGLMFGIWTDSDEIAFISLCLHHHDLIDKCLLSTYNKIHSVVHKPIADDIDSKYGMHGYQCHILVHTIKKTLWEQKFSYLSCSNDVRDSYLLMKPDQYADTFNYTDFTWKTELFSGKFQNFVIVDITMTDSNKEVIWARSYPLKAQKTSVNDILLEHTMCDSLFLLQHQDDIGMFSLTFSKEDCTFTPNVVLGVSFSHIRSWFSVKC